MRGERTLFVVWGVLVAATLVAWWVGHEHGGDIALVVLLGITFTKMWLVGRYFMELRHAPPLLRGLWDGWVLVMASTLAILALTL